MMIDRTSAPAFNPIQDITWITPSSFLLPNGIQVYEVNGGQQDIIRIEWVFRAGIKYQQKQLEAAFCSALMKEGTATLPAEKFSAEIDECGAFLNTDYDRDFASITLFCLTKYLDRLLPLIRDMVEKPEFPVTAFEVHRRNSLQQFLTEETKVTTLARKKLVAEVMGSSHYYGRSATGQDYTEITREDIIRFHQQNYMSIPAKVFVSGKIPADFAPRFTAVFGEVSFSGSRQFIQKEVPDNQSGTFWVEQPGAVQYAIRLGRTVPGPMHADHFALKMAVTVFGGYFGSRLMKNIREEKGYTYGIHAGISPLEENNMLVISAEVGNDYIIPSLEEIRKEALLMMSSPAAEEELDLVRNYLAGNLVKDADGPLAQGEKLRFRVMYNFPEDYHRHYIRGVSSVKAADIIRVAGEYLHPDRMVWVMAGEKRSGA